MSALSRAWPLRVAAVVAIACLLPLGATAQSGGRYFPETGHSLETQFIPFFDAHGGVDIFGYPITPGFTDPASGRFVQYTENARFEQDTDASGGAVIVLTPLGEIMGGWQLPDEQQRVEGRGCRQFDDSPHTTCYAFLQFFEANGGVDLFGVPTTAFIIESNRIVQYFQYFRLDWYPDAEAGHQVRVAPLGRQHFDRAGYDPELLQPATRTGQAQYRVTELRPSASVGQPSIPPEGDQQVYLVVRDQNQQPVAGAAALLIAHMSSHERYFLMPPTDDQGVSRMTLTLGGEPAGTQVNLEIWALYNGLETAARDAFIIR